MNFLLPTNIFTDLADGIEIFLNVLEFITLAVSLTTILFFMLNKFSKGLKKIFAPCGLGFFNRLKILIACRNSAHKKRAFIEFALLKTQGYGTINSEWKSIINQFKVFYAQNENELVYTIPNCTVLIGSDFSAAVERYFTFLKNEKVKKAFGVKDDKIEWVLKIHIEEAYATPTCLLTGLLSKYEESWEEYIKRYVSTAYMNETEADCAKSILTNELYFTFAWLLWGPSYELDYNKYWAGLCQLSFGDESNSVPAIANPDTNVIEKLRKKFNENENEGRRYGALISADLSLFEKENFYKSIRDYTNVENAYFYDKIESGEFSFAVRINSFEPCVNYKAKRYYCTAYVWLLFELEDDSPEFHPEKSAAFFEHANLTDKSTYSFLIETLINKCMTHFKSVFSDEKYAGRRYRFVCAFNDKLALSFKERYDEIVSEGGEFGKMLKDRLIMQSKRPQSVVFSAFDDFFTASEAFEYLQVDLHNKSHLSDLAQFYTNVYIECFPNANERETFDSLLEYLALNEKCAEYDYHILLLKDNNGEIVGGAIFDYFKNVNSAVIEFIAVKNDLQSKGLGSMLFHKVQNILSGDANRYKKEYVDNVFCEIDAPVPDESGKTKEAKPHVGKYLYFWDKNKFKRLKFNYLQPALAPDKQPVNSLWFTVAASGTVNNFSGETVLKVLYNYFKYCMRIDRPEENEQYRKMKEEIEQLGNIELVNII